MPRIYIILFFIFTSSALCEEIQITPLREKTNDSHLEDVDSQATNAAYYRDKDLVTSAHELSHSVNSRIRNLFPGQNKNGFYILGGKSHVFREPNLRLSIVARSIPSKLHCSLYKLYVVDAQRDWQTSPLYLFDEMSAYINGAATAKEYKIERRLDTTSQHAYRLGWFSAYVMKEIEGRRLDYEELGPLKAFWRLQIERLHHFSPANSSRSALVELTTDKEMVEYLQAVYGNDWCSQYLTPVNETFPELPK